MREIVVLSFVSLDGIMQAPGGPEEDETGSFKYGGWTFYYFDDFLGKVMGEQMGHDFDLLLGRKTYEIFASYWPYADSEKEPIAAAINKANKYSVSKTLSNYNWENSFFINKNVVEEIKKLKESIGPEIQVHGSGNLIQTLLKNNLVDELWLKTFPVTLGSGKRLFAEGTTAAGFELFDSETSPSGVIVSNYRRGGDVRTGSFAAAKPNEAEIKHQK